MDLLIGRAQGDNFLEESDEVAAGVASGGFAVNPAVAVSRAAYSDRVPWR